MSGDEMTKQIARWVALGALFLIPFTPLIVANSFFFPFITGKAFYFRILVEFAFGAWVALAIVDERYRPRLSWIEFSVLTFAGWMFLANLFAINVEKAMWSNFERMEGWVLLAHLAMFFLAASAVLRVDNKWRAWFYTSLGVSLVILFHALLQVTGSATIHQGTVRVDASFGNAIYLAIYLLFNTFIAGWLAFTEKREWLKWSLLALSLVSIIFIFFTQTRGTILALIGALILASILTAVSSSGRSRQIAIGVLVGIALLVGVFMSVRDTELVRQNDLWNRIAHISLNDGSARFMIWGMAWEGFKERPIVGWGQEGFNYVFNKYYNPGMYAQEPWFDRAHNAFIDWLMAGGLPAFLLYISLFIVGIWMLWRSALPRAERIALTCIIAGYAFHNLFVFDNLYSYVYFFAVLAVIDSQIGKSLSTPKKEIVRAQTSVVLPIASAAVLVLVYVINVPGIWTASTLISALTPQSGGISANLQIFTDLAHNPSFAAQEVREQIVSFATNVVQSKDIPDQIKIQAVTLAITEMQKQLAAYPDDAREHLQLALAYRTANNPDKVFEEIDAAIKLSPAKQQMWLQKGITFFELNRLVEAQQSFDKAYELGPQFSELAKYAALGRIAVQDLSGADEIFKIHPEVVAEVEAIVKQPTQAKK